jgi:RimJ/RimL family protein N-acetyltransferase
MLVLPLLDPPLSNGEIALRHWREPDTAALAALCQDETIVRWTNVPAGYTEHTARARIAEAEADRQAGRALVLAVVDAQTDDVLGACDLRLAANDPHCAEIAYMLDARAHGRGLMTEAVRLLSRWAIGELGVSHIEIFAHPENLASIAVAERAGFTRESLLPGYRVKKGRREDRVVLSLTASGLWS